MSNHTKGPWVAIARTNAYIDIEAPEQHGYSAKIIASISLINHEANARLIAAAPDLLEALQDIIDNVPPLWECTERAQAAIAKATGEQA